MKVKTNPEHQSFEAEKVVLDKTRVRLLQTIGSLLLTIGVLVGSHFIFGDNIANAMNSYEWEQKYAKIMKMYEENNLSSWQGEDMTLWGAPIDNSFFEHLPRDLKILNLAFESYIDNLDALPETCPDLEELNLVRCTNVTNYDFIYRLHNLKSFNIARESLGITDELIAYLNAKGIKHNLTPELVEIDRKIDELAASIINDSMTEQEKVDAIVDYVIKNITYDKRVLNDRDLSLEYNLHPFSYALKGTGCCINIASLTNALCKKGNVASYLVSNVNHAWNLVEVEGNYWYIDPTNLKNIADRYLIDPYVKDIILTEMGNINQIETKAPTSLLQNIDNSSEKYGEIIKVTIAVLTGLMIASPFTIKPDKKEEQCGIKK